MISKVIFGDQIYGDLTIPGIYLRFNTSEVVRSTYDEKTALSVRCLRD
jgi:hypothetical protein